MGKTNDPAGGKGKKPVEGTSKSRKKKAPEPLVENREYTRRLQKLQTHTVIFERGIHLAELMDTSLPSIVAERGWERLVQQPNVANVTLVREFYASMVPKTFYTGSSVLVRGIEVQVTEGIINNYYGTAPFPQAALPLGYKTFDGSNGRLASLLRGNDDERWDRKNLLKQSQLPKDLAILSLFISASLKPVTHVSSIAVKKAELLASFISRAPIDVGRVIKAEINDAGDFDVKEKKAKKRQAKKPIPFPCLITQLCRNAGVPEYDDDVVQVGGWTPVSLRSWTDSLSKGRGAKRLRPMGHFPPEIDSGPEESDEEDYDFEATGDDLNEDNPERSGPILDKLNWLVDAFKTSQISQERMEGKIDALSQQWGDYVHEQQEQDAEIEDIRVDVAAIRTQLGYQTYQRRERHRRPPPSAGPQGFSAADYMPDDMTPADIERMRRGQSSRG